MDFLPRLLVQPITARQSKDYFNTLIATKVVYVQKMSHTHTQRNATAVMAVLISPQMSVYAAAHFCARPCK